MDPLNWLYSKGNFFVRALIINSCHTGTHWRITWKGEKGKDNDCEESLIMTKE